MKDELVADFGIASSQVSAAAAFAILILSGFSAPHCGATVYDSDGSVASVQALHNAAHDGDTITLPAGTFSWNTTLLITKAITLKGQTTVLSPGTDHTISDDATKILDDTPRTGTASNGVIKVINNTGQLVRITGLAITKGSSTSIATGINGAVRFFGGGSAGASYNNRLDNCHIYDVYQFAMFSNTDWTYGVTDHCWLKSTNFTGVGLTNIWYSRQVKYGNNRNGSGDGAWADYPYFGTNKFWFLETSTIDNKGHSLDGTAGTKIVYRYNYSYDAVVHWHGTEQGPIRGGMAAEVYRNTFKQTRAAGPSMGIRSGTALVHDNVQISSAPPNNVFAGCINNNQVIFHFHPGPLGISEGTNIWDRNATDANGGFTEGAPPYLFESGTSTNSAVSIDTMTDTSKNWTTDQWKYYSIKNKNPASGSYNFGAGIVSNTANTITYINYWVPGTPNLGKLEFANGDQYEIHKILRIMDGCGVGKSDHLKTGQGNPPINLDHGNVPYYAHSASEPIYCWNNTLQSDGRELKWNSAKPGMLIREGIEYFNLGKGLANPPSAVTTRYDAALNGVQYNGDFTYPHPLVSGAPTPTPRATPRSQQHLQKKKKNSKKLKRRNWPKKIGD